MERHIGIRMTVQPLRVWNGDPTQFQRAIVSEPMGVHADPNTPLHRRHRLHFAIA
jgi:hypothetical protein